jgi:glutathione peroxidase
MFAKVDVNGKNQCALYKYLTSPDTNAQSAGAIRWNFEKFLLGRNGTMVARFPSHVDPLSPPLVQAIEREIAKP